MLRCQPWAGTGALWAAQRPYRAYPENFVTEPRTFCLLYLDIQACASPRGAHAQLVPGPNRPQKGPLGVSENFMMKTVTPSIIYSYHTIMNYILANKSLNQSYKIIYIYDCFKYF